MATNKIRVFREVKLDENDPSKVTLSFTFENAPLFMFDEDLVNRISEDIGKEIINKYNPKPKPKGIPLITTLERQVQQSIIGQNQQVRQIITAIYRAKLFKDIKANVLILGKSGTGKTETIKQIANKLNLPYTIEDATKYTQEGYVGASVTDMIYNLIDNANLDIERAQQGIIVIDEIDKKHGNQYVWGPDVSGGEVLKSLLKMIEGTTIKVPNPQKPFGPDIDFSTENLIIFFSGAFSGLEEIKNRKEKTPLGFGGGDVSETSKSKETKVLKQYLIEYGMPEEFVGRIDTIISMNDLNKEDLITILKKSNLSVFKKYKTALNKRGIELEYDEKLFELIAEEALNLDTGARELSNVVNYMFEEIAYKTIANPRKYTKCKLFLDIVNDNTKYKLS